MIRFWPLQIPHRMPREWTGASAMRGWGLATSALKSPFRNGYVGSVVSGHICPAFAALWKDLVHTKHAMEKFWNRSQIALSRDNRQDMKIVRISKPKRAVVLAFLFSPNSPQHMLETESRNHQIFRTEVAASSLAREYTRTTSWSSAGGAKGKHQSMLP